MLSIASRSLTPVERERLAARRADLRERIAAAELEDRRDRIKTTRAASILPALWVALTIFDVYEGQWLTAAVTGVTAAGFLGFVAWIRLSSLEPSLVDRGLVVRIDDALARDVAWETRIEAETAIVVRESGEDAEVLGDLLQTGPDELVFVNRSCFDSVAGDQLLVATRRIVSAPPVGVIASELDGDRIAAAGILELPGRDHVDAYLLHEPTIVLVLTPSTGRLITLDVETGEFAEYYASGDFWESITERARSLLSR